VNGHPSKIVIITDLLDSRAKKEEELAFYIHQLEILQAKMNSIRHEINLTTTIIKMIEKEKLFDLKDFFKSNSKTD
jgi:hypothetical protein